MASPQKEKQAMDQCSICQKKFILSDPAHFDFENGRGICRKCFFVVLKKTSWGSHRKKKVIFEYVKVPIPHMLKWKVWKRDGFKCKNCGSGDRLCVDHIHPESLGGELILNNLQTLCKSCNSKKGAN